MWSIGRQNEWNLLNKYIFRIGLTQTLTPKTFPQTDSLRLTKIIRKRTHSEAPKYNLAELSRTQTRQNLTEANRHTREQTYSETDTFATKISNIQFGPTYPPPHKRKHFDWCVFLPRILIKHKFFF